MLEELRTFISRTPHAYRIVLPRLNSYLLQLLRGTDKLVWRTGTFTTDPVPTAGIDYINSLITRADIPYLLKFGNDTSRLLKVFHEYRSAEYSDYIRQYPIRDKNFTFGRSGTTIEYLLITDDFDLIDNIPFNSTDFKEWSQLRPLRMLSNDSLELQLDIVTSRLRYRKDPPKEVVFGLNVVKLLMLYTKYRLLFPEEFVEKVNNYPFIFRFCLLPLLYDSVKDWMLKIVDSIVTLKKNDPKALFDTNSLITGEKSTFVIGGRHPAIIELENIITRCAEGELRPDELINSICIATGVSIFDEIKWLMNSNYIGNLGVQFKWLMFEREYFLMSLYLKIYSLQPDCDRTNELRKLFVIMTNRLKYTHFWASAGPFVSKNIEDKFDTLSTLI